MKKNMGTIDKVLRIIIAAVITGLFAADVISGTVGIILVLFAFVFVATSIVSFCPLYTLLGVSTCPVKKEK